MTPRTTSGSGATKGLVYLAIAGVGIAATCFVLVISGFLTVFNAQVFASPGEVRRTLKTGTYVVFERKGFPKNTPGDGGTLSIEEVTVTDFEGTKLPLSYPGIVETLEQNDATFRGAVEFKVRHAGTYTVGVNPSGPGQFMVAASLVGTLRQNVGVIVGGFGGGLVAVVSFMLLAARAVRRNRANHQSLFTPGVAAAAPPGWYPSGQATGGFRWWDGSAWTEHQSP